MSHPVPTHDQDNELEEDTVEEHDRLREDLDTDSKGVAKYLEKTQPFVWVKKQVTSTQWHGHFSKIHSYILLEKSGNHFWVAYKQVNPLKSHEYKLTSHEEREVENGRGVSEDSAGHNDRHNQSQRSNPFKRDQEETHGQTTSSLPF